MFEMFDRLYNIDKAKELLIENNLVSVLPNNKLINNLSKIYDE